MEGKWNHFVLGLCYLIQYIKNQRSKAYYEKFKERFDKRVKDILYFVEHAVTVTARKRYDRFCIGIVGI